MRLDLTRHVDNQAVTSVCPERARLVEEYDHATQNYLESLDELKWRTPTADRLDYERMRKAAEDARLAAETARAALERHVAEHGC
jgi:hypothetical protein